jgi:transcriptional regulator with XRE-family HTH domain
MSVLARNLKSIRKALRCSQTAMAEILKIGFRTYVRYEAGQRDAPASMLVKMAKMANVSLEKLLTREVRREELVPVHGNANFPAPEVKQCNFQTGRVVFKKPAKEGFLLLDEQEKRLILMFRRLSPEIREESVARLAKIKKSAKALRRIEVDGKSVKIKSGHLKKIDRSLIKTLSRQTKP